MTLALSLSIGSASPAAEPLPPDLEVLKQTIETGSREQALAIARDVIAQEPPDERRIRVMMYALASRRERSDQDLEIYRSVLDALPTPRTPGSAWAHAASSWAKSFQDHHPDAIAIAEERVSDRGLPDLDRALYALVLVRAARNVGTQSTRDSALRVAGAFMDSDTAILQEMGLGIAHRLWDYDRLPIVKSLAFTARSIEARSSARYIWLMFATQGPRPPRAKHLPRTGYEALKNPHDPKEAKDWYESIARYNKGLDEFTRSPEDSTQLPLPLPLPPSVDLRSTTDTTAPPGGTRPTESRPATDPAPLSASAPPLPASSTNERRPVRAGDPAHEAPNRPHP